MEDGINWYQRELVNEVSILSPGAIGWYRSARVTSVLEPETRQPLRRLGANYIVDLPDGSQVIYSGADAYREALHDGYVADD